MLIQIFTYTAVLDVAAFVRLSQVCKRFAYLVLTEESVWKRIVIGHKVGFGAMHYDFACDILGNLLTDDVGAEGGRTLGNPQDRMVQPEGIKNQDITRDASVSPQVLLSTASLLQSKYDGSWRKMFQKRPRVRFNGCYISTVNYTRPGASSNSNVSWTSPILIVTYYRYLRFFRDGTCLSLLTTAEPIDVVHQLKKENVHLNHRADSASPAAVMKDALRGRWRLSGPGDGSDGSESEGDLHVETEGVVPKYIWKMQFAFGSTGRGMAQNNKLSWRGFWSYNKLTDDWGTMALRHDKGYYWSRVKSYGLGY